MTGSVAELEAQALSVSDYVSITAGVLKNLGTAVVRGEIGELSDRQHLYFTLKDEHTSVRCLMFVRQKMRLGFRPREGMTVIAVGQSSLYQKNGSFSLQVQELYLTGQGTILEELRQRYIRLKADGLFALTKRQLPRWVSKVGIITSAEGRVLHDMLTTMARRNPLVQYELFEAAVQGQEAVPSLIRALQRAYCSPDCDVLIIGRGGGSFEDLLPFSDEALVRCIVQSPVPIISAVGHEPDISLSDYAADVRAATPTAAAEMVTALTLQNIWAWLQQDVQRLNNAMQVSLQSRADWLYREQLRLQAVDPRQGVQMLLQHLEQDYMRLQQAIYGRMQHSYLRLQNYEHRLNLAVQGLTDRAERRRQYLQQLMDQRLQGAFEYLNRQWFRLQQAAPAHRVQILQQRLQQQEQRLQGAMQRQLQRYQSHMLSCNARLNACRPQALINARQARLMQQTQALQDGMDRMLRGALYALNMYTDRLSQVPLHAQLRYYEQRLSQDSGKLLSLNPLQVLERGYTVTLNTEGHIIRDEELSEGQTITTLTDRTVITSQIVSLRPRDKDSPDGAVLPAPSGNR